MESEPLEKVIKPDKKDNDTFEIIIQCESSEELHRVTEWLDKSNLFKKIKVNDRTQAAVFAIKNSLI